MQFWRTWHSREYIKTGENPQKPLTKSRRMTKQRKVHRLTWQSNLRPHHRPQENRADMLGSRTDTAKRRNRDESLWQNVTQCHFCQTVSLWCDRCRSEKINYYPLTTSTTDSSLLVLFFFFFKNSCHKRYTRWIKNKMWEVAKCWTFKDFPPEMKLK